MLFWFREKRVFDRIEFEISDRISKVKQEKKRRGILARDKKSSWENVRLAKANSGICKEM